MCLAVLETRRSRYSKAVQAIVSKKTAHVRSRQICPYRGYQHSVTVYGHRNGIVQAAPVCRPACDSVATGMLDIASIVCCACSTILGESFASQRQECRNG